MGKPKPDLFHSPYWRLPPDSNRDRHRGKWDCKAKKYFCLDCQNSCHLSLRSQINF
jgi:hypothetical protein